MLHTTSQLIHPSKSNFLPSPEPDRIETVCSCGFESLGFGLSPGFGFRSESYPSPFGS